MCALRLDSSDGKSTFLSNDALLIWLDETGNESLSDDNYPFFGLGGCLVVARHYDEVVRKPWMKMRTKQFDGAASLHASGLRDPTPSQLSALSRFFLNGRFGRVASILSGRSYLATELASYQSCAFALSKRIDAVARLFRFSEVALLVEASSRGDSLARRYLGAISVSRVNSAGKRAELPMQYFFVPKDLNEPGLEVADFVMHAAGGEARARERSGKVMMRRDFQAVFDPVQSTLASFLYVQSVAISNS